MAWAFAVELQEMNLPAAAVWLFKVRCTCSGMTRLMRLMLMPRFTHNEEAPRDYSVGRAESERIDRTTLLEKAPKGRKAVFGV